MEISDKRKAALYNAIYEPIFEKRVAIIKISAVRKTTQLVNGRVVCMVSIQCDGDVFVLVIILRCELCAAL